MLHTPKTPPSKERTLISLLCKCRHKGKREGIHAVACIFGSEPRAYEDVAQMPMTPCTDNLYAHPIGIGDSCDAPCDLIIKTRPATTRGEFVLREIKGSIAAPADKYTCISKGIKFAAARALCMFVRDDVLLF